MNSQITDTLLMIRPTNFGFNEEAFLSNSFQNKPLKEEEEFIQSLALDEFNTYVDQLKKLNVNVLVFDDLPKSISPDSIFPNNWISLHENGSLYQHSMLVENRRKERRADIVAFFEAEYGFHSIDLSNSEQGVNPAFLEGTGSMIFDHQAKKVYAAISPRTDAKLVTEFAYKLGYESIQFEAYGGKGEAIYHTNVMLCIGEDYAVVGLDTIKDSQRESVKNSLINDGKEIIELSETVEWTNDRHEFYPTTDNLLSALGMKEIYTRVINEYLRPIAIHFYQLEGYAWDVLNDESFIIRYKPEEQAHAICNSWT